MAVTVLLVLLGLTQTPLSTRVLFFCENLQLAISPAQPDRVRFFCKVYSYCLAKITPLYLENSLL